MKNLTGEENQLPFYAGPFAFPNSTPDPRVPVTILASHLNPVHPAGHTQTRGVVSMSAEATTLQVAVPLQSSSLAQVSNNSSN